MGVNQDHGWDTIPEVPGSILGTCEPEEEEGLDVGGEVGGWIHLPAIKKKNSKICT